MGNFLSKFMKNYFGPLNKEYCFYFYFMSILFFIAFLLAILGILTTMFYTPKLINFMFIVNAFVLLFNVFVAYFVNRLLNTMCVASLNN